MARAVAKNGNTWVRLAKVTASYKGVSCNTTLSKYLHFRNPERVTSFNMYWATDTYPPVIPERSPCMGGVPGMQHAVGTWF